jgi:two-component system sensor histidine kinase UhpB
MERPLKVLLLEDSRTDAELIQRVLIKEKMLCEFCLAMNKKDFLLALEEFSPDVILSDNSMPKFDATEALQITRQRFSHIPFIMVTGTVSEEFAVNIIKQGADDYILKDRMTRLPGAIDAALKQRKAEQDLLQVQMRLKQAQETAHLGNWAINFETNTSKWSDEAYRIYGIEPGDHNISFDEWRTFIHPEDLEYVRKLIEESKQKFTDLSFYHSIVRKDGAIRHIYSESKYEFNYDGKPIGLYGIALDVTDKRKLEADLLEQQRKAQLKMIATALKAQEKERNAIGQELHDNVNQILVGTKMILAMVKNYPDRVEELMNSSIKNLQEAIDENRKIAHELVTPDFEATSLSDQILSLTDNMLKTSGLDTFIDTSRLQEHLLDEDQKLAIYRIAQEQCTNIVKYAKARLVNITLATNDNFFKMIVADDGVGMEAGKKTKGIGLRNIKGRLSIFNGTADISTASDKGFVLEIIIPL